MSEEVRALRVCWQREKQPQLSKRRVWFLDETGVQISMSRKYGRAWGGMRARGNTIKNRGENVTVLGAMRSNGDVAAMEFRGATDEFAMLAFIESVLRPALQANDVVIMDNLSVHKTKKVQAAFDELKVEVMYLPPYSPDLNPIEMCWSKFKTYLRSVGAKTYEALSSAVATGLLTITADDAGNWSRHCGYV